MELKYRLRGESQSEMVSMLTHNQTKCLYRITITYLVNIKVLPKRVLPLQDKINPRFSILINLMFKMNK